jgi:two-component system, chemotaxis family, chemotaxis protein CheY
MGRLFEISVVRVLVIEPSAAQTRIVKGCLQKIGFQQVNYVQNAADAMATLSEGHTDMVISAMYLPDCTGSELVINMREQKALADIPFLLISTETSYRFLEPIRQAGAVAILAKPFSIDNLRRALHAILDLVDPRTLELGALNLDDMHVLLVDDSTPVRRFMKGVLANIGFGQISDVANGVMATELMKDTLFDLLVTDYHMPEMDGKALIKFVREELQSSIPIIMVTSDENVCRLAGVQQQGADAVVSKPFEAKEVQAFIYQLLSDIDLL